MEAVPLIWVSYGMRTAPAFALSWAAGAGLALCPKEPQQLVRALGASTSLFLPAGHLQGCWCQRMKPSKQLLAAQLQAETSAPSSKTLAFYISMHHHSHLKS